MEEAPPMRGQDHGHRDLFLRNRHQICLMWVCNRLSATCRQKKSPGNAINLFPSDRPSKEPNNPISRIPSLSKRDGIPKTGYQERNSAFGADSKFLITNVSNRHTRERRSAFLLPATARTSRRGGERHLPNDNSSGHALALFDRTPLPTPGCPEASVTVIADLPHPLLRDN